MQLLRQLIFTLALLCCSCLAARPRTIDRCPAEFETLVEPLPASVGDPALLAGPGVQLRTVEFLRDTVLRVEDGRLLLNESIDWSQGVYNGPHVILCSDAEQPLATFSLFFRNPADTTAEPAVTAAAEPTAVYNGSVADPTADPTTNVRTGWPGNPWIVLVIALSLLCLLLLICLIVVLAIFCRWCKRTPSKKRTIYIGPSSYNPLLESEFGQLHPSKQAGSHVVPMGAE